MKSFNITGTCRPNEHYMVDITERLQIIRKMVSKGDYFCINRGRQYGKTTTLEAIRNTLSNEFCVFSISFEGLSDGVFENSKTAIATFLKLLKQEARWTQKEDKILSLLDEVAPRGLSSFDEIDFTDIVSEFCTISSKPVVILIDEVDQAGNNDGFIKFLGVLRNLYLRRASQPTFQSVILAGVYDVKNLKLKMRPEELHQYNSPWNIAVPFNVDMSLSAMGIKGMLDEYESDHHKGIDTTMVASWIREYTGGYPFLVSRLCLQMDEQDDWSHDGLLAAVKVMLNERNTLFDDMIKKIEQYQDLKALLRDFLFSGEAKKYNPDNQAFQLAEQFNIINTNNGSFSIACRIMETRIYEYLMSEEKDPN